MNTRSKIVVVGAGLAGLTTAYRLLQKGLDVHLYEARGRVGGRILTAKIDNSIAELGGHFITDGGEAENLYRLISECELELEKRKVGRNFSYFDGTQLLSPQQLFGTRKFQPETLRTQLNAVVQKAHNMQEICDALLDKQDPLYHFIASRMAAYEGDAIAKLSPFYVETFYQMLLGGLSPAYQKDTEDLFTTLTIRGGMSRLCEKMAQRIGHRVHLQMPLKKVAKTDAGYRLTFKNQQEIHANILVLAMPCSVYDSISFETTVLPAEKLTAIQRIQYGQNAKIWTPFLKQPSKEVLLANDRAVCACHEGILVLYYSLEAAKFSMETILESYKQERSMLEKVCGERCLPLASPVMAEDRPFVTYHTPIGYSWPNDPYAKGSYAYIAAGQEKLLTALSESAGEKVKTLFAPVDKTLYFAGEHASTLFEYGGTMEAACESGERIARMITRLSP